MIAVSEEMKNEDLKDPSNMEQEASEETASENTETSAEEKTTEKAPEKEVRTNINEVYLLAFHVRDGCKRHHRAYASGS